MIIITVSIIIYYDCDYDDDDYDNDDDDDVNSISLCLMSLDIFAQEGNLISLFLAILHRTRLELRSRIPNIISNTRVTTS